MCPKRAEVGERAVALVVGELECGEAVGDIGHEAIARYFGDDGSCCYAKATPVSADDGLLRELSPRNPVPVNKDKSGRNWVSGHPAPKPSLTTNQCIRRGCRKRPDGGSHRLMGGLGDANCVNSRRIDPPKSNGPNAHDLKSELLTFSWRQTLRVIDG